MTKTQATRWTLIVNPHSVGGKARKEINQIKTLLDEQAFSYGLFVTEYAGHAVILTKEAIKKGERQIIAVGGDGTLNEVVNGIFHQQACGPDEITVAMIPVGTGNDWIKTFGIPNNYKGAIGKIKEGKTIAQDIGKLTFLKNGKEQQRFFANMAGFGFDALAACKANAQKEKGRNGFLVYLKSILGAFLHYKTQKVKIFINGENIEEDMFSISVGIGKYNGNGMKQAPFAIPDDGQFVVTWIKEIGLWGILANLPGLYSGKYINDRRVFSRKTKELSITAHKSFAAEVDGESLGEGSFHVQILPRALRVVAQDTGK